MADISIIIKFNLLQIRLAITWQCSKLLTLQSYTEYPYLQMNCPSIVSNDEYTELLYAGLFSPCVIFALLHL